MTPVKGHSAHVSLTTDSSIESLEKVFSELVIMHALIRSEVTCKQKTFAVLSQNTKISGDRHTCI